MAQFFRRFGDAIISIAAIQSFIDALFRRGIRHISERSVFLRGDSSYARFAGKAFPVVQKRLKNLFRKLSAHNLLDYRIGHRRFYQHARHTVEIVGTKPLRQPAAVLIIMIVALRHFRIQFCIDNRKIGVQRPIGVPKTVIHI